MSKETKVGLFLVVCIALIIALSAMLTKLSFSSDGIDVSFYVDDASGIVEKSPVMYKGIDVGFVTGLALENGNVAVYATLYNTVRLPNNIKISVAQDGLIGSRFINIIPDETVVASGFIEDGDSYSSYKPTFTMDDLAESAQGISSEIGTLVSSLNEVFATDQGQQEMKNILTNLDATMASLRSFTDDLDTLMTAEREDLMVAIANIREITEKAKTSLDNIDAMTSSITGTSERAKLSLDGVDTMTGSITGTSERAKLSLDGVDTMTGSITDTSDRARLSLDGVDTMTSSIAGTSDSVNKLVNNVNEGEGTIGMLMTDNETRDKLKDTINGLYTMMEKQNQLVLELEGSLQYLERHDDYLGSFNVSLWPNENKFYLLGLSSSPQGRTQTTTKQYTITQNNGVVDRYTEEEKEHESNTIGFNLQYGMIFNPYIGARGGIFDSRLGFAVDVYPLASRDLVVSGQMSDFFRDDYGIYYNVGAKYYFGDYFFLQAGWDDIGSSAGNSFFAGAGIRFIDNDLKYIMGSIPVGSIAQ